MRTRTKIAITSADATINGDFTPDHEPAKNISALYNGLTVEEHEGTVIWSAPIQLSAGFKDSIGVSVNALVCKSGGDNRCMPVEETLVADFAGDVPNSAVALTAGDAATIELIPEKSATPFRDGNYAVEWTAVLSPNQISAGQSGVLQFTAKPDPTFHVYKAVIDDTESSTNFVVTDKDGLLIGQPVTQEPFVTKSLAPGMAPISYYKGKVTWQLPFKIPADAPPGEKAIEGMIGYQACTDSSCLRPFALKFTAKLNVGDSRDDAAVGITLASTKRATALDAAATTKWADQVTLGAASDGRASPDDPDLAIVPPTDTPGPTSTTAFPIMLGFAFLGGLILNVMPCVLPVVGLKIMGSSRALLPFQNLAGVSNSLISQSGWGSRSYCSRWPSVIWASGRSRFQEWQPAKHLRICRAVKDSWEHSRKVSLRRSWQHHAVARCWVTSWD